MKLALALNRYDRHMPFFMGTVQPPRGFSFSPLEVGESVPFRDGDGRHERMLNHLAFDIAEMSLSSFIMAVARNPGLPLVGVPVFPRRFFTAGQVYVNARAGIEKPADLNGRKVGVHAFQVTMSVLGKGDLKLDYGVDWKTIHWHCMRDELVPVDFGPDVRVGVIDPDKDIGVMLCDGEIDAMITPQPRKSMLARPGDYRRLFPDVRAEEVRYFSTHGYWPIMHLIVMKRELAERFPELPRDLISVFDEAKRQAYQYYDDSNYSLMADARLALEAERRDFGPDPWPNGLAANRKNLERFIGYSHDQRLIAEPYAVEQLFHPSTHET
ncbi:MAG: ABC transporter substrate-binding protein [Beijerinckiaceae bacterium]